MVREDPRAAYHAARPKDGAGSNDHKGGRVRRGLCAAVAAIAAALLLAPAASAVDKINTKKLRKGVTLDGILEHERALQRIAIAHDGNRAATTAGYDASVDYVVERLRGRRLQREPRRASTSRCGH